jgi:hypothetical protein
VGGCRNIHVMWCDVMRYDQTQSPCGEKWEALWEQFVAWSTQMVSS